MNSSEHKGKMWIGKVLYKIILRRRQRVDVMPVCNDLLEQNLIGTEIVISDLESKLMVAETVTEVDEYLVSDLKTTLATLNVMNKQYKTIIIEEKRNEEN